MAQESPDPGVETKPKAWWAFAAAMLAGVVFVVIAMNEPGETQLVAPDVPATAMDLTVGSSNNSPQLVADPTNSQFVVLANRIDAPSFSCALQASGDGGASWIPIDPVPKLPPGADRCYGSEAAFDGHGTLYFLFVGLAGDGNQPMGAYLTKSTDQGQRWTEPQSILGAHNFSVRLAIDPTLGYQGRIQIVWLTTPGPPGLGGFPETANPILAMHSDDGGKTFSAPVQVSSPHQPRVVAPGLTLGPDHHVHVVYYDLRNDARDYQGLEGPTFDGTWSLYLATSSDGGNSFATPGLVDDGIVPFERVMLIFTMPPATVGARPGNLCIGWPDARYGDADVLVRCSSSGGKTWHAPVRVNDDPISNGYRQFMPRLSFSPNGRLDVVYLDRDMPLGNNNETAYSFSTDDGKTFSPRAHVSQNQSSIKVGAQYGVTSAQGLVEFGSRLGSLSRDDDVLLAWPDTRNSTTLTTEQDVFTTRVKWVPDSRGLFYVLLALSAAGFAGFLLLFTRWITPRDRGLVDVNAEPSDSAKQMSSLISS